jgi:hypothetical protein
MRLATRPKPGGIPRFLAVRLYRMRRAARTQKSGRRMLS